MGQFTRLATAMEGGGQEGQWTWARYRAWIDSKKDWVLPSDRSNEPVAEPATEPIPMAREPQRTEPSARRAAPKPAPRAAPAPRKETRPEPQAEPAVRASVAPPAEKAAEGVLVIDDIDEDPAAILEKMQRR